MRPIDQPHVSPAPAAERPGWPSLVTWTVLIVLLVVGAWAAATYNQLTRAQQAVDAQWAQVESVYQRRADLVPNLVSVTQGYLTHERALFEAVARARQLYTTALPGSPQRVDAATELQRGLVRLIGIIERYPDLRSQAVVLGLMDELAGSENRIAVERRRYNERTRVYNQLVLTFPRSVVAGRFGFRPRPYFQAEADAATAPTVR
jgi:LemA protein